MDHYATAIAQLIRDSVGLDIRFIAENELIDVVKYPSFQIIDMEETAVEKLAENGQCYSTDLVVVSRLMFEEDHNNKSNLKFQVRHEQTQRVLRLLLTKPDFGDSIQVLEPFFIRQRHETEDDKIKIEFETGYRLRHDLSKGLKPTEIYSYPERIKTFPEQL